MSDNSEQFPFTPVERAAHARLTPQRQREFITALAETGLVAEAARVVGVSVAALEKLRYADDGAEFRAAWDAARQSPTAKAARTRRRAEGLHGETQLHCASPRPSRRTSYLAFRADPPEPGDPLLGFVPYLHPCPRRNSITPDRQRAFIAALAASGSVTQAARTIGASVEALYKLRARGGAEGFAAAWEKAIDLGMARLEDTALARALEGEERPIVSGGKLLGTWKKHNEALVMFLLRHRRAARYGSEAERQRHEVPDEQEIIDSINRKLDLMRERLGHGATVDGDARPDRFDDRRADD